MVGITGELTATPILLQRPPPPAGPLRHAAITRPQPRHLPGQRTGLFHPGPVHLRHRRRWARERHGADALRSPATATPPRRQRRIGQAPTTRRKLTVGGTSNATGTILRQSPLNIRRAGGAHHAEAPAATVVVPTRAQHQCWPRRAHMTRAWPASSPCTRIALGDRVKERCWWLRRAASSQCKRAPIRSSTCS